MAGGWYVEGDLVLSPSREERQVMKDRRAQTKVELLNCLSAERYKNERILREAASDHKLLKDTTAKLKEMCDLCDEQRAELRRAKCDMVSVLAVVKMLIDERNKQIP